MISSRLLIRNIGSKTSLKTMLIDDIGNILKEQRKDILSASMTTITNLNQVGLSKSSLSTSPTSTTDAAITSSTVTHSVKVVSKEQKNSSDSEGMKTKPKGNETPKNSKLIKDIKVGDEGFTVCGRISIKYPVRNFVSQKDGKPKSVASLEIIDEFGDQIRISYFSKAISPELQSAKEGEVYMFHIPKKYGRVSESYSKSSDDDVEITVAFGGSLIVAEGDFKHIPLGKVTNLVPIYQLAKMVPGERSSTVGIIADHGELQEGVSITGKEWKKMSAQIMDESGSCDITLWNDDIDLLTNRAPNAPPVFAFHGCSKKNEDFLISPSRIIHWPKINRSSEVASWFASPSRSFNPNFSPYIKGKNDFFSYYLD